MRRILAKLRYMFSVEEEGLSEEEVELVGRVARAVVGRGLAVPALTFLESVRPLNFVGSQVMIFSSSLSSFFPFVYNPFCFYPAARQRVRRENLHFRGERCDYLNRFYYILSQLFRR